MREMRDRLPVSVDSPFVASIRDMRDRPVMPADSPFAASMYQPFLPLSGAQFAQTGSLFGAAPSMPPLMPPPLQLSQPPPLATTNEHLAAANTQRLLVEARSLT